MKLSTSLAYDFNISPCEFKIRALLNSKQVPPLKGFLVLSHTVVLHE